MLSLTNILINVPITLIALTFHECAHGWVSTKLGDPTPRREGRLSLNPLVHLDPIGTLLMIFTGFGWARPVSVNPMYYRDRKKGMALTAAAGPIANLVLSIIALLIGNILLAIGSSFNWSLGALSAINSICYLFVFRNLCFMVFNLIPIPPLDGSKILGIFLPNRIYYDVLRYEQYAIILIMLLSVSGAFDVIIGTGVSLIFNSFNNAIAALVLLFV